MLRNSRATANASLEETEGSRRRVTATPARGKAERALRNSQQLRQAHSQFVGFSCLLGRLTGATNTNTHHQREVESAANSLRDSTTRASRPSSQRISTFESRWPQQPEAAACYVTGGRRKCALRGGLGGGGQKTRAAGQRAMASRFALLANGSGGQVSFPPS